MAGYNKELDRCLWRSEPSPEALIIKVMKYGERGKVKLAFARYFEDNEGEMKETSSGRLTISDVEYFGSLWPQAKKIMKSANTSSNEKFNYPDEIDQDEIISEQGISIYDESED